MAKVAQVPGAVLVFSREFRDGPHWLQAGLAVRGDRLEIFAASGRLQGRKRTDVRRMGFSPNLPLALQAAVVGALKMWGEKKVEVKRQMRANRAKRRS